MSEIDRGGGVIAPNWRNSKIVPYGYGNGADSPKSVSFNVPRGTFLAAGALFGGPERVGRGWMFYVEHSGLQKNCHAKQDFLPFQAGGLNFRIAPAPSV